MAVAVFNGSLTSGGGGAREVFTEQNRQPRVHVSPNNCSKIRRLLEVLNDLVPLWWRWPFHVHHLPNIRLC